MMDARGTLYELKVSNLAMQKLQCASHEKLLTEPPLL